GMETGTARVLALQQQVATGARAAGASADTGFSQAEIKVQNVGNQLDMMQRKLYTLAATHPDLTVKSNFAALDEQINMLQAKLNKLSGSPNNIQFKTNIAAVQ